MKNYDKNQESSYLEYLHSNNFYGQSICEKLPVNGFKWVTKLDKFNEDFIKNYNEDGDVGYFLDVDIEYPKNLHKMHSDLPFLPEQRKIGKIEKLVCGIEDKEKYVTHINALKQALNHGLRLINVHRVIEFNQQAWLKPYIDMNTELRKEAKNDFEKDFFKLMNNSVFGKTMENVRKHRVIKLVTTEKRRLKLVSEENYLGELLLVLIVSAFQQKQAKKKNENLSH